MDRRNFVKNTGLATAAITFIGMYNPTESAGLIQKKHPICIFFQTFAVA